MNTTIQLHAYCNEMRVYFTHTIGTNSTATPGPSADALIGVTVTSWVSSLIAVAVLWSIICCLERFSKYVQLS